MTNIERTKPSISDIADVLADYATHDGYAWTGDTLIWSDNPTDTPDTWTAQQLHATWWSIRPDDNDGLLTGDLHTRVAGAICP